MNNDDLEKSLAEIPMPSAASRHRIQAAAMAAFREQHKKIDMDSQGNNEPERPTRTTRNARKHAMKISQISPWLGGLAACCLLTLGYITFEPDKFESQRPVVQYPSEAQITKGSPSPASPLNSGSAQLTKELPEAKLTFEASKREELVNAGAVTVAPNLHRQASAEAPSTEGIAPLSANTAQARSAVNADKATITQAAPAQLSSESKKIDSDIYLPPQSEYRDRFTAFTENPLQNPRDNPVSTFSVDVDTASYSFVRRQLQSGRLPQQDAVRIEEIINYFDYAYPRPKNRETPFSTTVAVLDSPWRKGNRLVHLGIQGYTIDKQPDSNLVFLLDVSGSMESPDKLPLVKQSLGLLLNALKPSDHVAIVVYAGAAGTVLEPTQVKERDKILAALNRLQAGGSTAGAQGLQLAYQLAEQHFDKKAVNRVILATDGDFNVGITQDERLEDFVKNKKDKGIYLSVLGFGEGNYQDALMQTLAQNGNGNAAYIDSLSEARKVLVDEATSSLFPIANDVKIQVEFNPALVKEYRLIGYETRALQREDFNNDKVDAGDIGAGHSVTAIYEITPVSSDRAMMDKLRYGKNKADTVQNEQEYGFVKLRYKLPGEQESRLISTAISSNSPAPGGQLKQELNFANAVAGFAQILRGGKYIQDFTYDDVIALAQSSKGPDAYGYRSEFIQLVHMAKIAQPL